jgi:hypothetical protein
MKLIKPILQASMARVQVPQLQALTAMETSALQEWEERSEGNRYYSTLPREYRTGAKKLSPEDAKLNYEMVDEWMTHFKMQEIFDYRTKQAVLEKKLSPQADSGRTLYCREIGLSGFRGLRYVPSALAANLTVELCDWSRPVLRDIKPELAKILDQNPESPVIHNMVKWCEARRELASQEFDHDSTRILILATIIEHIGFKFPRNRRLRTIRSFCRNVGKVLRNPKNRVIIINTPLQGNHNERYGSIGLDDDWIFDAVQSGTRKPIVVRKEDTHKSMTSFFTARSLQQKAA